LRHQHFDLTKQHHDLLRAKPLLRHVLAPFQAHPLTKLGPRNPGQVKTGAELLFEVFSQRYERDPSVM
jgi:hypothetical protein